MHVLINSLNMNTDESLQSRLDHCLETALQPVQQYLEGVDVYLTDVNGPRGGPDKQCGAVARMPGQRAVVVSRTDRDPAAAVSRAVGRLRRSIQAAVKRRRTHRRPARTRGLTVEGALDE